MSDPVKSLYDELINQGESQDILGSLDEFSSRLSDPTARDKLWQHMSTNYPDITPPKDKYEEALLELKTIKDEDFKELKEAPKHEHLIQLQIYLNLTDRDYGVVLYENKNDQNFKAFKVDRDDNIWKNV